MHGGDSPAQCREVRGRLYALRRGTLVDPHRDAVVHHLEACAECRHESDAEALLDRLLLERLPRPEPSPALRRRLSAIVASADDAVPEVFPARAAEAPPSSRAVRRPSRAQRWARIAAPALAASVALVAGGVVWGRHTAVRGGVDGAWLVEEAIGDHLRMVAAAHPLDIESSASHEVKPWFEGRIDFAPNVPRDVGELRLRGGSIGYFLGRKAAIVSYALRRHAVTLIAVPATGLPWPAGDGTSSPRGSRVRGIEAIFWRHGDIGYALVADVSSAELGRVAGDLYRATAG